MLFLKPVESRTDEDRSTTDKFFVWWCIYFTAHRNLRACKSWSSTSFGACTKLYLAKQVMGIVCGKLEIFETGIGHAWDGSF